MAAGFAISEGSTILHLPFSWCSSTVHAFVFGGFPTKNGQAKTGFFFLPGSLNNRGKGVKVHYERSTWYVNRHLQLTLCADLPSCWVVKIAIRTLQSRWFPLVSGRTTQEGYPPKRIHPPFASSKSGSYAVRETRALGATSRPDKNEGRLREADKRPTSANVVLLSEGPQGVPVYSKSCTPIWEMVKRKSSLLTNPLGKRGNHVVKGRGTTGGFVNLDA